MYKGSLVIPAVKVDEYAALRAAEKPCRSVKVGLSVKIGSPRRPLAAGEHHRGVRVGCERKPGGGIGHRIGPMDYENLFYPAQDRFVYPLRKRQPFSGRDVGAVASCLAKNSLHTVRISSFAEELPRPLKNAESGVRIRHRAISMVD